MAEETRDPRRVAPWGMVIAVGVSGLVGYILLVALTLAIRSVPAVLAAPASADVCAHPGRFGIISVPAADLDSYPVSAAAALRQIASAEVPLENAPATTRA